MATYDEEDRKQALKDALLAAGFGMLTAQNQRGLAPLGYGGLLGLGQYRESQQDARRQRLAEEQNKYRQAQIARMESLQKREDAQYQQQQASQRALTQAVAPLDAVAQMGYRTPQERSDVLRANVVDWQRQHQPEAYAANLLKTPEDYEPQSPIGKLISDMSKFAPGTETYRYFQRKLESEGVPSDFFAWREANPGKTYNDYLKVMEESKGRVAQKGAANVGVNVDARPLPAGSLEGLAEMRTGLKVAESVVRLIDEGYTGTGPLLSWMPDYVRDNYANPEGVNLRAMIADMGSLQIKKRSGAVVTASEFPRLKPFIPQDSDTNEVVYKKVKRFVEIVREELEDRERLFSGSGYRLPGVTTYKLDTQGNLVE